MIYWGFKTYDSAVFTIKECNWNTGCINDSLGIANDFSFRVDGSLALFASDQEESGIEFSTRFQKIDKCSKLLIGGMERACEAGVGCTGSIKVAGVLLRPCDGLGVGTIERWRSRRILGAVDPITVSPIAESRPFRAIRTQI